MRIFRFYIQIPLLGIRNLKTKKSNKKIVSETAGPDWPKFLPLADFYVLGTMLIHKIVQIHLNLKPFCQNNPNI
jgi:hypothetical protein